MDSSSKIKPLGNGVLIKPFKKAEKTSSGIYIPDSGKKERPQEGEVIAVGPGKKDEPMNLKPGQHVIFKRYSGSEYDINDETYLIMDESDILAFIE